MTQAVGRPDTATIGSLRVRRLGFGALHLTGEFFWGPPPDRQRCVRVLRRAADLGVDLFDTADSYGPQVSEELICEALHPYEGIVVSTKAGLLRPDPREPREWPPCGRPDYLRQQCELSLRRLRVDVLDVFHLHRIDPTVPAEEQFGVLAELRAAGKVREVGLSEVTVAELEAALAIVPVAVVQNLYNLIDRRSDPVLERCAREGVAFTCWYPLQSGALAAPGHPALDAVAREVGATPAQVALAWLLQRSPSLVAIPGTRDVGELEENCAAAAVELSAEQFDSVSKAFQGGRP